MYPLRASAPLPTLIGAVAGTDQRLPFRAQAFEDPRSRTAEEFADRLVRNKMALEAVYQGEVMLLAPDIFPFYYALVSDQRPEQPPKTRRGAQSALTEHAFRAITDRGALTRDDLIEQLGGALSESAMDRVLQDLRAALKIARTVGGSEAGEKWDLYLRLAPEAIQQGRYMSEPEALSAIISKYLDCAIAASKQEIEDFIAPIAARSRVAELLKTLTNARHFRQISDGTNSWFALAHPSARPDNAKREPRRTPITSSRSRSNG